MSASGTKILIVDDDPDIREVMRDRLKAMRFQVVEASDGEQALALLRMESPTITLLDLMMPKKSGLDVLKAIHDEGLDTTTVVMTAYGTIEKAVEAMRAGAYDFLTKPFSPGHLEVVIGKALEREGLKRQNLLLAGEIRRQEQPIIGHSEKIRNAIEVVRRAAASSSTILLLGETGTGKEVFAKAIHHWSPRRDKPFVVVNCVALSEELLESELFGHERGAFTGAHQRKCGKLELADGGTAFLDEIGDLKPRLQAKLLRVLQEHEFERVGGIKPIRVDLRFVAATNRRLDKLVREGLFREDLFFRLNVVSVSLPPLRERPEDIVPLTNYFLARYSSNLGKRIKEITPDAWELLQCYYWPGNVRELANIIERAVVLSAHDRITSEDLAPGVLTGSADPPTPDVPRSFHEAVTAHKRQLIREALYRSGGNQSKAASALGLQRTYLSRLIKELQVGEKS
ncbi:Fis family transcriptional regulator [Candidatus Methylomirabilis lanthanidiphila]|uniref:Fis family transcriptional regulator n=1 Tax=Candidatus Methylomirabilis lanthanidiphila TaxID=2211376 RepID=A0A564ZMZ4_9BACT|nr:sigma-54 dependent transcriptional regulator [Candidatus Methylomirabilis lanthanidiphila]VUZ85918.1 Fis family transcriptional regulator [Candidatus Methylomirabilis lanthanidiphila]